MPAKTLYKKFNKFLNSRVGICVTALVTLGMSIYSMFSVIRAFNRLDARTDDMRNTLENWKERPLMEVDVVSIDENCGDWEDMTTLEWPGTTTGPCACPSGATQNGETERSGRGSCDRNQTRAGCEGDPPISSITLEDWRSEQRVCGRRGGEPSLTVEDDTVQERPRPTGENGCPDGYQQCGDGTFDENRAICFPEDECPIRVLKVMTESDYLSEPSGRWDGKVDFQGSDRVLAFSRSVIDEDDPVLPAIDHTVGLEEVCVGETRARQFQRTTGNIGGNTDVDSSCDSGLVDRRYKDWDELEQDDLMDRTFVTHSMCTSPTVPISFNQGCRGGDNICDAVNGRDTCDKLRSYARDEYPVFGFVRGEIYWRSDCPTTREELREHVEPLEEARDLQRILMTINVISNVVVGVIVPLILVIHAVRGRTPCFPGSGESEKKLIDVCKTWYSMVFRVGKFIPLVLVTQVIAEIDDFYVNAAEDQCSDQTTEGTMDFLADTLENAYLSNIGTGVVDGLQVLFSVYSIYTHCTGDDKDEDEEETSEEKEGKDEEEEGGSAELVENPVHEKKDSDSE